MVRLFVRLCAALLLGVLAASAQAQSRPPAAPLEAYGRLPAVENVSLSPSGKRYAAIAVAGETRKLIVGNVAGGMPIVSAPIGDVKIEEIEWAGEDHLLVTKRETQWVGLDNGGHRAEASATLQINLVTGKQFFVLRGDGGRPVAELGYYGLRQIGGKWYGFWSGLQTQYDPLALYRVDLETGDRIEIDHQEDHYTNWLIGQDGKVAARTVRDSRTGEWKLLVGETDQVILARRARLGEIWLGGFGRSFDTVLVGEEREDGEHYTEIAIDGSRPPQPIGEGVNMEGTIRSDAGLLIGLRTWDGERAQYFDPRLQARWKGARKAFPGYETALLDATADLGSMIVRTDAGDDSGTYWTVDIAAGGAKPLGRRYPAIEPPLVGPTRMIAYTAADGLKLDGVLTLPPGREAKGLPLIVMPHGGPLVAGDRPGFDWWAQAFAARGYAVFQPNFRGTLGYGADFERAAYGQWGLKMQTDISDGMAELARQGIIDPARACIVGASYGGYAALAGVTVQRGLYRCAASWGGVTDLRAMTGWLGQRTGRGNTSMRVWLRNLGVADAADPRLDAVSPAKLAAQAGAPVLLIHGKDDTVVPVDQSRAMQRALTSAGKPVEYVELPGEDHWLSRSETRLAMLQAMISFVEKHNPAY